MTQKLDLTGQRFGRLIAVKETCFRTSSGAVAWECLCDCGKATLVAISNLRRGKIRSCGCLMREMSSKHMQVLLKKHNHFRGKNSSLYKHGDADTRLYNVWQGMKQRCYHVNNPTHQKYYREKNIIICSEWKDDYISFKKWAVASGYQDNLTIDRVDNYGNYEPSNCQWLSKGEHVAKTNRERNKSE